MQTLNSILHKTYKMTCLDWVVHLACFALLFQTSACLLSLDQLSLTRAMIPTNFKLTH
ncbi:hypothetical protein PAHAL_9G570900 [Panicum hallii]|uniref:Uncharacterized protein n=1 Tax=Panicum hallii TaxID=206008 RepID=A0A2T8I624_9POAL|nr:hypothetical protein PAHAL_9G570900 [Panicum hallii]